MYTKYTIKLVSTTEKKKISLRFKRIYSYADKRIRAVFYSRLRVFLYLLRAYEANGLFLSLLYMGQQKKRWTPYLFRIERHNRKEEECFIHVVHIYKCHLTLQHLKIAQSTGNNRTKQFSITLKALRPST